MKNSIMIESNNELTNYTAGVFFALNKLNINIDKVFINKEAFLIAFLYSENLKYLLKYLKVKNKDKFLSKNYSYSTFLYSDKEFIVDGYNHLTINYHRFKSFFIPSKKKIKYTTIDLDINGKKTIFSSKEKSFNYGVLDTYKALDKLVGHYYYFDKDFYKEIATLMIQFKSLFNELINIQDEDIIIFMVSSDLKPWYISKMESEKMFYNLFEETLITFDIPRDKSYNNKTLMKEIKKAFLNTLIIDNLNINKPFKEKDIIRTILIKDDNKELFKKHKSLFLKRVLIEVLLDEKI